FWIYASVSVFLIIRYWKKYTCTELVLYFFLLFEAFSSQRNIPIWIIPSFSLTIRGIGSLYKEAAKYPHGARRFGIAYVTFCIIAACLFLPQLGEFFYGAFSATGNQDSYPTAAVAYLHSHTPQENIFSTYDWGGYLIWQLPQKKVFIDG